MGYFPKLPTFIMGKNPSTAGSFNMQNLTAT